MNIFRSLPLIIKYAPLVYSAVNIIEDLYGSAVPGPEKKRIVLAWLADTSTRLNLPWGDAAVQVVSNLIDTVVGIYNFIGVFRNKEDADESEELKVATQSVVSDTKERADANVRQVTEQDPALKAFMEQMER